MDVKLSVGGGGTEGPGSIWDWPPLLFGLLTLNQELPGKERYRMPPSQGACGENLPLTLEGCLVPGSHRETVKLSVQPAHLG